MINISKDLKYFFILPAFLSLAALFAILTLGLKPGIDLAGGSLLHGSMPLDNIDVICYTYSRIRNFRYV